jgi:hypothetical protein
MSRTDPTQGDAEYKWRPSGCKEIFHTPLRGAAEEVWQAAGAVRGCAEAWNSPAIGSCLSCGWRALRKGRRVAGAPRTTTSSSEPRVTDGDQRLGDLAERPAVDGQIEGHGHAPTGDTGGHGQTQLDVGLLPRPE